MPKIEEWDKDWTPDWSDFMQEKWFVNYLQPINKFFLSSDRKYQRTFAIYMSEPTARKVMDILNKAYNKDTK